MTKIQSMRPDDPFPDLHPPLSTQEAATESDRCLFCYDAPCVDACPTGIDVPLFIRRVSTGNFEGAARAILSANIMGGTCARACPTEVLCEDKCVMNAKGERPIEIGQLQRFAVDSHMHNKQAEYPFQRAPETGKHIAVVGAGPAGLACAHALAINGHSVTVLEAEAKPGGLNEYGLAPYKMTDDFAQQEVDYILRLGGIELKSGVRVGDDIQLDELVDTHDAVATVWEQELAAKEGVLVRHWLTPAEFFGENKVGSVRFVSTRTDIEHKPATIIQADKVLLAIGQLLRSQDAPGVSSSGHKFITSRLGVTSRPSVFAGGDCIDSGEDLTVQAVEDGKQAAIQINAYLKRIAK